MQIRMVGERPRGFSPCYADRLPVYWSPVGPLLDRCGLRATFHAVIHSDFRPHPERRKALAAAGRELGKQSPFHPRR